MRKPTSLVLCLACVLALAAGQAVDGKIMQPVAPKEDAQCLGSPFHLATDNIPLSNDYATSIINEWAFVDKRSGDVTLWLYKTDENKYWIQSKLSALSLLRRKLDASTYNRVSRTKDPSFTGSIPVQVSPKELSALETKLKLGGVYKQACFSKPYRE
jgi:hypothetical protein